MSDPLMDELTEARKQVRLAPLLTLSDHEYAHERGICVDNCPFCEETRRTNVSNEFDKPLEPNCCISGEDLQKIPLTLLEPNPGLIFTTLNDRGANYGDFENMSNVAQGIKDTLKQGASWPKVSPLQREALDLIATKLARIVCGNPNYPDSWHDIQGYAKKVEERIPLTPAIP